MHGSMFVFNIFFGSRSLLKIIRRLPPGSLFSALVPRFDREVPLDDVRVLADEAGHDRVAVAARLARILGAGGGKVKR